jgi:simple sugar transport system ATP-binding protein
MSLDSISRTQGGWLTPAQTEKGIYRSRISYTVSISMTAELLRMEKINKWFGAQHALRDVDFEADQGQVVGLFGGNGAGKSTLIKIISGFHKPDSGDMYIQGKKVSFSSPRDAREYGIETVYQELAVIKDRNIPQNIFLGREPERRLFHFVRLVDENVMRSTSENVMAKLGLNVPLMQEAQYCSGGERQGVAIARCLNFGASLVILDEPFSALGFEGRRIVTDFIKTMKEKNIGCIAITHDIHHLYDIIDRIVIFSLGKKIVDTDRNSISMDECNEAMLSASYQA